MVFQDYALFPHLTVTENVGFGLPRERPRGARADAARASSGSAASASATRTSSRAGSSSGSRSRARSRPPRRSCCSTSRGRTSTRSSAAPLRDEVAAILRPLGVTVVLVTHDREEAFSLADRIALMRDGTIVQEGTPEELYQRPQSPVGRGVRRRGQLRAGHGLERSRAHAARVVPAPTAPPARRQWRCSCGRSCSSSLPTPPARPRSSPASSAGTTSSTASSSTASSSSRSDRRTRSSRWAPGSSIHVHGGRVPVFH